MKSVVFDEAATLAEHILFKTKDDSRLRMQKTLYFMYAFYSNFQKESTDLPEKLFDEPFEAWAFGPVLHSIYSKEKIEPKEWLAESNIEEVIMIFLDDALSSINKLGDFELVARAQEDSAWREAYIENSKEIGLMNSDTIAKDYR